MCHLPCWQVDIISQCLAGPLGTLETHLNSFSGLNVQFRISLTCLDLKQMYAITQQIPTLSSC